MNTAKVMRVSVIKARCIACGKRWEVSVNDKREAQAAGCVISPCCNFPSTVESVKVIEKSA